MTLQFYNNMFHTLSKCSIFCIFDEVWELFISGGSTISLPHSAYTVCPRVLYRDNAVLFAARFAINGIKRRRHEAQGMPLRCICFSELMDACRQLKMTHGRKSVSQRLGWDIGLTSKIPKRFLQNEIILLIYTYI